MHRLKKSLTILMHQRKEAILEDKGRHRSDLIHKKKHIKNNNDKSLHQFFVYPDLTAVPHKRTIHNFKWDVH